MKSECKTPSSNRLNQYGSYHRICICAQFDALRHQILQMVTKIFVFGHHEAFANVQCDDHSLYILQCQALQQNWPNLRYIVDEHLVRCHFQHVHECVQVLHGERFQQMPQTLHAQLEQFLLEQVFDDGQMQLREFR